MAQFVPGYARYREGSIQVTEVWASQAPLNFLLQNGMALWLLLCSPSPSRLVPGLVIYPLVFICVWNPVEELETVIRGWD